MTISNVYQEAAKIQRPSQLFITSNYLFKLDDPTGTTYSKINIIRFFDNFNNKR